MFADCDCRVTEFHSLPRTQRLREDKQQQTAGIELKNAESQSSASENKRIQTESNVDGVDTALDASRTARLVKFLTAAEPVMSKQLWRNLESRAFDAQLLPSDNDANEDGLLTRLHSLYIKDSTEMDDQLQCSDICWSSTGSTIAIAYGSAKHQGWCTHPARVAFWNLNRQSLNPSRPDVVAATDVCITCLRFHPTKPAMLVGGNYNGEILMWNLTRSEDPLVTRTTSEDAGHDEPVTCVRWIPESGSSGKYSLASCSLDGRILIWTYNGRQSKIQLLKGFVILAEDLPRSMRPRPARLSGEVGVIGMAVGPGSASLLYVGLEGGGVLHCSLESKKAATGGASSQRSLFVPKIVACAPHDGQVTGLASSVLGSHLLATCSSDCELRVYGQAATRVPIITVHCPNALTAVDWSPARAATVAVGTADGRLIVYDLSEPCAGPRVCRFCGEGHNDVTTTSVTRIQFNAIDFGLVAVGDAAGVVHVWRLADQLAMGDATVSVDTLDQP